MTDTVALNLVNEGLVDHKLRLEELAKQQSVLSGLLSAVESASAVHQQRINDLCDTVALLHVDLKELRNSLKVETNETNETTI
jgi:hypothetical protein